MGPVVDATLENWTLRPFQTSNTFKLLQGHPYGVFHVIDEVLLIVRAALQVPQDLEFEEIDQGWVLKSACHWYQLQIVDWNVSDLRSEARAKVIAQGTLRPFWGWNRAKHSVLEATILMTRLHLLEREFVSAELARLAPAIEKTAGPSEKEAWRIIHEFFESRET